VIMMESGRMGATLRRVAVAVIVAGLLWPSAVEAQSDKTAVTLLQECEGRGENDPSAAALKQFACYAYMQGFLDSYKMTVAAALRAEGEVICLPPQGISGEQTVLSVTKWMRDNPGLLHESARSLVLIALMRTFPCR
jgi:hypothetical protein